MPDRESTQKELQAAVDAGIPLVVGRGTPVMRVVISEFEDPSNASEVWLCDGEFIEIEADASVLRNRRI